MFRYLWILAVVSALVSSAKCQVRDQNPVPGGFDPSQTLPYYTLSPSRLDPLGKAGITPSKILAPGSKWQEADQKLARISLREDQELGDTFRAFFSQDASQSLAKGFIVWLGTLGVFMLGLGVGLMGSVMLLLKSRKPNVSVLDLGTENRGLN